MYRFYCIWENKRRDRTGTAEAFDHAYEDDLTDRKVGSTSDVSRDVQTLTSCRIRSSDISIEGYQRIGSAGSTWLEIKGDLNLARRNPEREDEDSEDDRLHTLYVHGNTNLSISRSAIVLVYVTKTSRDTLVRSPGVDQFPAHS